MQLSSILTEISDKTSRQVWYLLLVYATKTYGGRLSVHELISYLHPWSVHACRLLREVPLKGANAV